MISGPGNAISFPGFFGVALKVYWTIFGEILTVKNIKCIKEKGNPYDSEALKAVMKEIGIMGYIENSRYIMYEHIMNLTDRKLYTVLFDAYIIMCSVLRRMIE